MFCTECGAENRDGAGFCIRCGSPLETETPPVAAQPDPTVSVATPPRQGGATGGSKKKSPVPVILGVTALVLLLAGGGAFAAWHFLGDGEDDEKTEEAERPPRERGRKKPEGSGSDSSDRGGDSAGGGDTATGDPEAPAGSVEETYAIGEGWEFAGEAESLMSFLDDTLVPSAGYANFAGTYKVPYLELSSDGYTYPCAGYVTEVGSGVVNVCILDFDRDGQDEMLALMLDESVFEDGIRNITPRWYVYEQAGQRIYLAATRDAAYGALGGVDVLEHTMYVRKADDVAYVVEHCEDQVCVTADGTGYGLCVWHYDGEGFVEDFEQSYWGSDFSDTEEEIAAAANELNALGFTETAARLDINLGVDERDGLELLFLASGKNMNLSEAGWYGDYYETGDIRGLGTVEYRFFRSKVDYQTAYEITGYQVFTDDFSAYGDGVVINATFDRIVFTGEDADSIDWLNRKIQEMEDSYEESLVDLDDMLKGLEQNPYSETQWDFQPMVATQVYYDEDGNVSVCYSWYWYMGGVVNTGSEVANYNVRTRNRVWLHQILGVDAQTAAQMVLEALYQDYDFVKDLIAEGVWNLWSVYDIKFCFDESQVTVFFDPYELGQGGHGLEVVLPRQ